MAKRNSITTQGHRFGKVPSEGQGEFSCWCYLTVIEKDAEIELCRHVFLPFVPRKGITLQFEMDQSELDGPDFTPHHILYVVAEDVFWIYGQLNSIMGCPCKPRDECCVAKSETLSFYQQSGWKIERVLCGKERRFHFPGMFGEAGDYSSPLPDD